MKARRAARELALLSFSQLVKDIDKAQNIEELVVNSVRIIVNNAESNLKRSLGYLIHLKDYIENYEIEHPTNTERHEGIGTIPVPLPLTSDMLGHLDTVINAVDNSFSALEIAEISSLSYKEEVRNYTINLVKCFIEHKKEVDEQISLFAKGWNIDRLVKIDRDILRIAITELLYFEDTPVSVSIDEAVELAKKYSMEESSSFINGILGQVAKKDDLYKLKKR